MHYRSVVYTLHLNIMLVHAQNVKQPFDIYFIVIGLVMIEIYALFGGYTLVAHMPNDHVTVNLSP